MKIKEIVIFLFVFIGLLFASEFVYFSYNKHALVSLYLNYARASAHNRNMERTLKYLGKVGEFKLKEVALEYSDLALQTSITIPPLPNNPKLNQAYTSLLQDFSYDAQSSPNEWARLFYNLGLAAYKNNEIHLPAPFWQIAISFVPEWSYLHVELANFYLIQNNGEKALSTIEYCQQFHSPREHCRQFMEENIQTNSPKVIGSWEKEISDI